MKGILQRRSVSNSHDPVTITQNGTPTAVVIDHESYHRTGETLAMLKLVAMGMHELEQGRTVSQTKVFKDARTRLKRFLAEQEQD